MRNNTDHGHFFEVGVAAALEFRALVRTPPDASNSELLLLLMMEGKSCTDVATFPRCDVAACGMLYWLTQRCDVGTARRGDVVTLGRHDVPDLFMHSLHMLQNCFQ